MQLIAACNPGTGSVQILYAYYTYNCMYVNLSVEIVRNNRKLTNSDSGQVSALNTAADYLDTYRRRRL